MGFKSVFESTQFIGGCDSQGKGVPVFSFVENAVLVLLNSCLAGFIKIIVCFINY